MLLACSPVALGQSGFYGQQRQYAGGQFAGASIYQPTMTAMTVFQAGDSAVPIPQDPGAAPAPSPGAPSINSTTTPLGTIPPNNGSVIASPDPSLPIYQNDTTWNAFSPPVISDPFLQPGYGQQGYGQPYGQPGYGMQQSPYGGYTQGVPPQGMTTYGANGAQPYRFGWQNRLDVSWMPGQTVTGPAPGASGDVGIFGVDYELAYGTPFLPGWVLNWTNQFGYRNWDGPGGQVVQPRDLYRFGIDFELETPQAGPFSISLGVTPSINTDLNADPWKEGLQIDGRGIMFFQLDQYWTLGLGAQYWDRVDDRIIPWAGLIYRDDFWEWQLMYPEARISVFLGNEAYWAKWAYVRAEYHVEAYGIESSFNGGAVSETQFEVEDYRVLGGFKMDAGSYNWFIEGGWVFNREVKFANATPGYEIGSGFIGQIGLRF
jgi:hypothetical protein